MRTKVLVFVLFISTLFSVLSLFARENKRVDQKVVRAIRAQEPVVIDGRLEEKVWQSEGYSSFVQSDPIDGAQPSEKTTVWVAYDDRALYVAAFLYDSQPELIKSRLGRRDDFVDSDWFFFAVDPYYDRRTGYQFAVNPANSICDWTLFNDLFDDSTWDGIWEWKALINDKGWTVEIKIPYNQIRFPKKKEYVWGVNFSRLIRRKNEKVFFAWVPKEETAYVSRFARLEGIKDIRPGRHIEFFPYTVGEARFSPAQEGNPFQTGHDYLGNLGFDLKVGLMSNLTLDATVNPDFGQVEVDPAVINLSAYETYYQEKRPFFIEGSSIFDSFGRGGDMFNANINWSSPTLFYSRRIGRTPQGYVTQPGYVKYPDRSTILGAFKLTGKVGKGWNMSFINAFTSHEYAEIDFNGERFREEVEPFSYYGVFRAQKDINGGAQGVGILATGVVRDLGNQNLASILNRNAFSLAADGWTFLDKKRTYVISGWVGGTLVNGSETAILRLQRSSLHFFQRPDAAHVEVNEEATSLAGWAGRIVFNKQSGVFLFSTALGAISPGFDPNDIGFQFGRSDLINGHIILGYRWPHPGKVFRNVMVFGGFFRNYNFGGVKTWDGYLLSAQGQFLNYWNFETMIAYNPDVLDSDLTRGGPLALIPSGYQINANFSTDSRKAVVLSSYTSYYRRPRDGHNWNIGASLRWKPRSNFSFSLGPNYSERVSEIQYLRRVEDPLMTATYGARYVFGKICQRVLSSVVRLNWIFTPRLSLQLYLQPFIAVGKYSRFKELAVPRTYEYNVYGEGQSSISFEDGFYVVDPDGAGPAAEFAFYNPDFNMKSLRGTMVLRWEYLPGSILYLVWTQDRADFSNPGVLNLRRDLGDLLTAPGDNIFLVKVSYRWNM
ncbi:MAG: DUF5916 domain-containing protein [Candidatus Aminicenantales bacterium]